VVSAHQSNSNNARLAVSESTHGFVPVLDFCHMQKRRQHLVVFYCGDHQTSKVIVHQLIADCGFVGLDAGRLRMAKELEAPGRMNRAGLIGIAKAKRLLYQLTGSAQNGSHGVSN
jgi:predicted dinucleotide-binding enzyme